MNSSEFTAQLKCEAQSLGFDLVGVCPAVSPAGLSQFHEWLNAGYGGEMQYLSERKDAYAHPRSVLDGVRSVVMMAMNYKTAKPDEAAVGSGRVSRYAWGQVDYHDLIHDRLRQLREWFHAALPDTKVRGVVDTAPLLEREFAQLAGLGWVGKHTLLINRGIGSWFFLAALLTDVELAYDDAQERDYCGSCTACLEACPTDAFPQPYVLDATRCISYLTIELREAIPVDLRGGMENWVFGCDICQDVCPWNSHAPPAREAAFHPDPEKNPINLLELFALDDEAFRVRFRHTPLWRARRRGILRNAAIVLGNQRATIATEALMHGLNDPEPLVREAVAWALWQVATKVALEALRRRLVIEDDEGVRQALTRYLAGPVSGES